jgi:NitT/TauT family transport system substrate-binding protein
MTTLRRRVAALAAAATLALAALSACGSGEVASIGEGRAATVRLGYFANVTHAAAIVGVDNGLIKKELGDTALETTTFNAGPAAVEALFSGSLDAAYIGPNPAINAFAKSNGEAIRIIAGATSGGAQLIVSQDIDEPADLAGKTLATPSLGNTQDVALRSWLKDQGFETNKDGTGDVNITPTENAQTLTEFQAGRIDGAWVPEPWASRMVLEADGKVLVDEKDLWPNGEFVTTHLIVRTEFLEQFPETVEALLRGHVAAVAFAQDDANDAKTVVNDGIEKLTSKRLPDEVIDRAWPNLAITNDPIASSLQKSADDAAEVGLSDEVDLQGIYDLSLLNSILKQDGEEPVSSAGLGKE